MVVITVPVLELVVIMMMIRFARCVTLSRRSSLAHNAFQRTAVCGSDIDCCYTYYTLCKVVAAY